MSDQKNILLNIETTTKNCSVSLTQNGMLLAVKELNDGTYSHAEFLHIFIDDVLKQSNLTFQDLNAVAISKGPGSYTGLRIGVSAAKGLAFALNIPLIAVDTLEVLARKISVTDGIIIPMLDARRMEVYQAVFDKNYNLLQPTDAVIIESDTYTSLLDKQYVHFIGDAVVKCQEVVQHHQAVFHANTFPSAIEMGPLSYQKFLDKNFVDIAYFEPYYLKDFIVVKKQY